MFKNPKEWIGELRLSVQVKCDSFRTADRDLRINTGIFTPRDYVKLLNEHSKVPVVLKEVSREEFEARKETPQTKLMLGTCVHDRLEITREILTPFSPFRTAG